MNENFLQLQETIEIRQKLIKDGKRFQGKLLGIFDRFEKVSFEEQVVELEGLITDYHAMIQFIQQHKDAYRKFFMELTEELKMVFTKKLQELYQLEQKRLKLESRSQDNSDLLLTLQKQKKQIFKNTFILHRSAQLMLKKIELISKSIQRLSQDQDTQRRSLTEMMDNLKDYHQVYALQIQIDRLEEDIKNLAEIALNFEQFMSDCLSPFQGLIDQVVKEYHKAIEDYSQVMTIEPNRYGIDQKWVNAYYELEKSQQVPDDYHQMLTSNAKLKSNLTQLKSKLAEEYNQQGESAYQKKDYHSASAKFSQALEINPQYVRALVNRGDAFYQLEEYQKAIKDYSQAIIIDPHYKYAYGRRAKLKSNLAQLKSKLAEEYNQQGESAYQKKDYHQAIAKFSQALEINSA